LKELDLLPDIEGSCFAAGVGGGGGGGGTNKLAAALHKHSDGHTLSFLRKL
jgi:hypothetical protein